MHYCDEYGNCRKHTGKVMKKVYGMTDCSCLAADSGQCPLYTLYLRLMRFVLKLFLTFADKLYF